MILAVGICLAHALLFGCAARRVSESRAEPDGFWWGFWLGALGLLIVVFRKSSQTEIRISPPGSSARRSWKCTKCGACNPEGKERCQSCTASRTVPNPTKVCPSCGAKNKAVNTNCFACGHSF